MRKIILTALCCCALSSVFASTAFAQELIVGGQAVGIQISLDGVMVAGFAQNKTGFVSEEFGILFILQHG